MFSTLSRIGLLSIPSILLYGGILNNYATAFKIQVPGRDAQTRQELNNLQLCDDLQNAGVTPPAVFAIQTPATACGQRGGTDDWILEELPAFTSAYSYFAVRSTPGNYIIHRTFTAADNGVLIMKSGLPGVHEMGNTYVKSEFWIARNGQRQLINSYNPVQNGDVLVLAGPGPAEPHTRFHAIRAPSQTGLPPQDYRYPLFAVLPEGRDSLPADADILVSGLRIRLEGSVGELVIGPSSPLEVEQEPVQKTNTQGGGSSLFLNRGGKDRGQPPRGQNNQNSQNMNDFRDPGQVDWNFEVDSASPDLQLEDLRITRTSGREVIPEDRAWLDEAAKLLGLPTKNPEGNRGRIPGEIGAPGSGLGEWDESRLSPPGLNGRRYYHRPPEVGPDGETYYFPPMAIREPSYFSPPSNQIRIPQYPGFSGPPPMGEPATNEYLDDSLDAEAMLGFGDEPVNDNGGGSDEGDDGDEDDAVGGIASASTRRSKELSSDDEEEDEGPEEEEEASEVSSDDLVVRDEIENGEYQLSYDDFYIDDEDSGSVGGLDPIEEEGSSGSEVESDFQRSPSRQQYGGDRVDSSTSLQDMQWGEQSEEHKSDNEIDPGVYPLNDGYKDGVDGQGNAEWDSTDRSYDEELLVNWDNNEGNKISSTKLGEPGVKTFEMQTFGLPPAFDVGLPEDKVKPKSAWQKVQSIFSRKPKNPKKQREPTGFE
ncbi:hypothetical protein TWF281_002176 [Arthrobotrys megalospora]